MSKESPATNNKCTSESHISVTEENSEVLSLLQGLKNISNSLSTHICSTLNKTGIADVSAAEIKSCNKLSKEFLADKLLQFLKHSGSICGTKNFDSLSDSLSFKTNMVKLETISTHLNDVSDKISTDLNSSNIISIESQLANLTNAVNNFMTFKQPTHLRTSSDVSMDSSMGPPLNTDTSESPKTPPPHSTTHIEVYNAEFLTEEESADIMTFITNQNNFKKLNGRSVLSLGEPYQYNGSPKEPKHPIPDCIEKVMTKIEEKFPGSEINSCLINKYVGNDSFLPEHSDDEKCLKSHSNIFTASLGKECTVDFVDCSGKKESQVVEDRSLYLMSQQSQYYWRHRIDKVDCTDEVPIRYSLTFRCVGDNYRSSTVILGDSNTKYIKFGTGKGTFGWSLPGKCHNEIYTTEKIDPNLCVGYQNIVVHIGINDLKDKKETGYVSVQETFLNWKLKIEEIQKLCPYSKVIVSEILPTKIPKLNARAIEFNQYLCNYRQYQNKSLKVIEHGVFADQSSNSLKKEYGCFKNQKDRIHLGSSGIRLLASKIREAVLYSHVDRRTFAELVSTHRGKVQHLPP